MRVKATTALGKFGAKAQPHLVNLLQQHSLIEIRAAAARSLGQIGAATGDTSLTPLYLDILTSTATHIRVKIDIVWALGKAPDFQSHSVLEELESEIWQIRPDESELQKLREAVDWSIREVRQGGHTGAYY